MMPTSQRLEAPESEGRFSLDDAKATDGVRPRSTGECIAAGSAIREEPSMWMRALIVAAAIATTAFGRCMRWEPRLRVIV
jgi:hypothetical protein